LDSIRAACRKWDFELWAYVIMPEHVHLLVFPAHDGYSISDLLKSIKQPVARKAINYLRINAPDRLETLRVTWPAGRVEHRFWEQGGGYDRNIYTPKAAWGSVEYLHLNPVRRGLVGCDTDWAWSSARCYAGMAGVELPVDNRPPDPV
jgi:putative transposase